MNKQTRVQIAAAIGTLIAVPLLYVGLQSGSGALAVVGFAVFTVSMLATPAMKITTSADRRRDGPA